MRNTKLSSLTLWLAVFGTAAPFACSSPPCNGPGGLCIEAPGDDDGEPGGIPNAGGASSGGSSTEGGAPRGGSGEEGGNPSPGGAGATGGYGEGGEGTSGTGSPGGRGGAVSAGGSGGRGGAVSAGGSGGRGGAVSASGSGGRGGSSSSGAQGGTGPGGQGGVAGRAAGGAGRTAGGAPGAGAPGRGGAGPTSGGAGTVAGMGGTPGGVLCAPPSAFTDACPGDAGAGGASGPEPDWCSTGTSASHGDESEFGAGATGGATAAGGGGPINGGAGPAAGGGPGAGMGAMGGSNTGPTLMQIDAFEDGDAWSEAVFGGRGVWYVANDGSGLQFPKVCPDPLASSGVRSTPTGYAMHTYGSGFLTWAQLGLSFRSSPPACDQPIDAREATGVRFRAKGVPQPQTIRLSVQTVATNPPNDGGTCDDYCYDGFGYSIVVGPDFQEYQIPFAAMTQQGWGTPVFFDPGTILNIVWSGQVPCFDFWIDDVAFYRFE